MHELSLARRIASIIDAKGKAEDVRSVRAVWLEVGPFSCVEPQALRSAFAMAAQGTRAEGAALEIETCPAEGRCPDCAARQAVLEYFATCDRCGAQLDLSGGDALRVARMEVV